MFDALQDTPRDFQTKLIDALNSLAQTMDISPEDAFNQVLCASNDENQDVKKRMYNWWRAFFEVLGKVVGNMPKDRSDEFTKKIDALMAEIMKAGDASTTDAVEEGDVVSEGWDPDDSIRFGRGDIVDWDDPDTGERHRGWKVGAANLDQYELFPPDGGKPVWVDEYYMDKVRKFNEDYEEADKADEDDMLKDFDFAVQHIGEIANKVKDVVNFVNPYCETKEVYDTMKKTNERGGSDWVSMDDMIGMEVGESDNGEDSWKAIDDVDDLEKKEYWKGVFKVGDKVSWFDPEYDEITSGWTVTYVPEDIYDDEGELDDIDPGDIIYTIENEDGSEAEALGSELRPAKMMREGGESEPMKQKMDEASVVVDANDVWDVLDLLDDETANKNLTDLINSHVRTEEEIMDAIDGWCDETVTGEAVTKAELNDWFANDMESIVVRLGLDAKKFKETGEFVDPKKPVALEGSEEEQKPDEVKDGEKKYKQDGETKTLVTGSDKENKTNDKQEVTEMTIEQEITHATLLLPLLWGQGKENLQALLDSDVFHDEEGDVFIVDTLEEMGLRNLTEVNDAFAYDFESILEALGCDPEAWTQRLEIQKA